MSGNPGFQRPVALFDRSSSLSDVGFGQAANSKTARKFRMKAMITIPVSLQKAGKRLGIEVFTVPILRFRAGGFA